MNINLTDLVKDELDFIEESKRQRQEAENILKNADIEMFMPNLLSWVTPETEKHLPRLAKWVSEVGADQKEVEKAYKRFMNSNLKNQDIFQWKTFNDFKEAIRNVSTTDVKKVMQELEDQPPVYEDDRFVVYSGVNQIECMFRGKGYSWCVSAQANNHFHMYRSGHEYVFYFIFDKTKPKAKTGDKTYEDPEHAIVLGVSPKEYNLTLADNGFQTFNTKTLSKRGVLEILPQIEYLFDEGVFEPKPLTSEEKKDMEQIKRMARNFEDFEQSDYDTKMMYILSGEPIDNRRWELLDKKLKDAYIESCPTDLTPEQKADLNEKQKKRYTNRLFTRYNINHQNGFIFNHASNDELKLMGEIISKEVGVDMPNTHSDNVQDIWSLVKAKKDDGSRQVSNEQVKFYMGLNPGDYNVDRKAIKQALINGFSTDGIENLMDGDQYPDGTGGKILSLIVKKTIPEEYIDILKERKYNLTMFKQVVWVMESFTKEYVDIFTNPAFDEEQIEELYNLLRHSNISLAEFKEIANPENGNSFMRTLIFFFNEGIDKKFIPKFKETWGEDDGRKKSIVKQDISKLKNEGLERLFKHFNMQSIHPSRLRVVILGILRGYSDKTLRVIMDTEWGGAQWDTITQLMLYKKDSEDIFLLYANPDLNRDQMETIGHLVRNDMVSIETMKTLIKYDVSSAGMKILVREINANDLTPEAVKKIVSYEGIDEAGFIKVIKLAKAGVSDDVIKYIIKTQVDENTKAVMMSCAMKGYSEKMLKRIAKGDLTMNDLKLLHSAFASTEKIDEKWLMSLMGRLEKFDDGGIHVIKTIVGNPDLFEPELVEFILAPEKKYTTSQIRDIIDLYNKEGLDAVKGTVSVSSLKPYFSKIAERIRNEIVSSYPDVYVEPTGDADSREFTVHPSHQDTQGTPMVVINVLFNASKGMGELEIPESITIGVTDSSDNTFEFNTSNPLEFQKVLSDVLREVVKAISNYTPDKDYDNEDFADDDDWDY